MAIRIDWDNNEEVDSIKVFRSTSKFDSSNLPAQPIAVLDSTADSFVDTITPKNTPLYYMIAKYKGEDVMFSPLRQYADFPYTGIGPSKLSKGDWRAGWFGEVNDAELFNGPDFISAVKVVVEGRGLPFPATLNRTSATNQNMRWQKFVYNGKILFIPLYGVSSAYPFPLSSANNLHGNNRPMTTWNELYAAGLLYGIDGVGYVPPNVTPTDQGTIMSRGGVRYRVRTIRLTSSEGGSKLDGVTLTGQVAETVLNPLVNAAFGGEVGNTLFRMFGYHKNVDFIGRVEGDIDYEGHSFASEPWFDHDFGRQRSFNNSVYNNYAYKNRRLQQNNLGNGSDWSSYGYATANFIFPYAELTENNASIHNGSPVVTATPPIIGDSFYYDLTRNFKGYVSTTNTDSSTNNYPFYAYPYNWVPVLELIYD